MLRGFHCQRLLGGYTSEEQIAANSSVSGHEFEEVSWIGFDVSCEIFFVGNLILIFWDATKKELSNLKFVCYGS